MHLIIAKYDSDPERKRIEYALEKWREKLDISKPTGLVAIVDGADVEGLVEELYSRTKKENVTLYHIEKVHLDIAEVEKEIRLKLGEKKETAERLLDFIMAGQKAILKFELAQPREKVYEVYTKKGKAQILVSLRSGETGVNLRLRISGYGEAVDLLCRKLEEQLRLLEEAK